MAYPKLVPVLNKAVALAGVEKEEDKHRPWKAAGEAQDKHRPWKAAEEAEVSKRAPPRCRPHRQ